MSESAGQAGRGTAAVVHESYSFACMRCGHGWEQSYEIEHHHDVDGHEYVRYIAEGSVVPSPLSRPTCHNCDSHVVRIMRPGRVSFAQDSLRRYHREGHDEPGSPERGERHHWHLSDLLHPFQHRKAG
ncbi:hypothetical protein AB0C59_15290 [Streptomyces sp. NPDC048664]|uniref:hypothetical protein n=1 Tax=Streptomyces sp. NPDC048664 TaxID=3154505 RepID=UPI0034269633